MTLYLETLSYLDKHQHFLQKRSNNPHLFLVGGCIRDLLLGFTRDPLDIDFTMEGTPETLYADFNTQGLSHFITEKFGTITFIPAENPQRNYQLTPLRTEGNYGDFRHPGEIQRSNDLLLDVQRRDFTMNAMYYFSLPATNKTTLDFVREGKELTEEQLLKLLEREGYCYLANLNLLMLRAPQSISQIFGNAQFDEAYFRYLIETQKEAYFRPLPPKKHSKRKKSGPTFPTITKFRVLIDPTGGLNALVHKKCTTVGEADKRFGEDALRLMRAIRMVNTLNTQLTKHFGGSSLFDFSPTTRESIQTNAHLLPYVAKERVKEELTKIFVKGDPFGSIVLLNVSGMLAHLFPALFATKYNEQPIRYHAFDTYTHTLLALKALQEINSDYLVRFAMLYHDVGKVAQYAAYEKATSKEEIRAIISGPLNHRNSSPELMKQDFKALGFSGKEIETIARYILEHHTPGEILQSNPAHREKKVRKLLSEKGFEMVNNLFDINIADRMGQFNPLQGSADLTDSYQLKTLLKKLNEEEGQFKKSDLAINGTMIMKHLKLAPGAIIGELLKQAFDRVLNDIPTRNTEQEILIYLKNYLRNKVVNPTNNSTMKE